MLLLDWIVAVLLLIIQVEVFLWFFYTIEKCNLENYINFFMFESQLLIK